MTSHTFLLLRLSVANLILNVVYIAAVSYSLSVPMLGRVRLGLGLTGKLGRAWVGAWVVDGVVHGVVW